MFDVSCHLRVSGKEWYHQRQNSVYLERIPLNKNFKKTPSMDRLFTEINHVNETQTNSLYHTLKKQEKKGILTCATEHRPN